MALNLQTATGNYGHTESIIDGSLNNDKLALDWVEVSPIIGAFRRMIRGLEFDVSEMAISTYLCAKSFNKPITAIPVFPVRGFHHGAISYNTKSGVSNPKDLEGKKVGVRGWTVTTGVWVRGILKDGYGVDIDKITWVLAGDEHVQEYQYPPNVVSAPEGSDLAKMLVAGEIAAGIGVGQTDSEDVKPLISDGRNAGVQYFKDKGVYPINHTVVVKDELLAANPWLAEELFNTFKAAKASYITKLDAGADLSDADQAIAKNGKDVGGDPLPYGLAANNTTMEAIIQACVDQKVIPSKVSVEEMFAPSTVSLS
jgi:4,5-dihydroxyphthalate decarboxylase